MKFSFDPINFSPYGVVILIMVGNIACLILDKEILGRAVKLNVFLRAMCLNVTMPIKCPYDFEICANLRVKNLLLSNMWAPKMDILEPRIDMNCRRLPQKTTISYNVCLIRHQ